MKLETESGKSRKLRRPNELGKMLFVVLFLCFYMTLTVAASIFCNWVCIYLFCFVLAFK